MPILTPAFPNMSTTFNVSTATMTLIEEEIHRAKLLIDREEKLSNNLATSLLGSGASASSSSGSAAAATSKPAAAAGSPPAISPDDAEKAGGGGAAVDKKDSDGDVKMGESTSVPATNGVAAAS